MSAIGQPALRLAAGQRLWRQRPLGPDLGWRHSHVSFGNDTPDKYRRTLAHEIGHNIAFCHNNRFIDTIGFDVLESHTVKGTGFRDFMWPARREDEAWIDTTNYNRLFGRLAPGATFPSGVSDCCRP